MKGMNMQKIRKFLIVLALFAFAVAIVHGCNDDHGSPNSNEQVDETPSNPDDNQGDDKTPDDNQGNDDKTPDDNQGNDKTPDENQGDKNDSENTGEVDPCAHVECSSGVCDEGICVTTAMKAIKDDTECDSATFVDFCDGNRVVYCDHGGVVSGECSEGCAVYTQTYHGIIGQHAGCIDGGACTHEDELKRTCTNIQSQGQVLATACQRTTRNTLQWISVNGYYCEGLCDAAGEKCALTEEECDPYEKSNYACDRNTLTECRLSSNLIAKKRTSYCEDKCVSVNGVAMCGIPCDHENDETQVCIYADSLSIKDLGTFICTETDSGDLYSIWTGDYELCNTGCSDGVCQ